MTYKKNHQIIFRTNKDVIDLLEKLYPQFQDFKKSVFYEKVFILGLEKLLYQIKSQDEDFALDVLMRTKINNLGSKKTTP